MHVHTRKIYGKYCARKEAFFSFKHDLSQAFELPFYYKKRGGK